MLLNRCLTFTTSRSQQSKYEDHNRGPFLVFHFSNLYDMVMKQIECRDVILRHFLESDLYDFYNYARIDGVGEKAGWRHHLTIEMSKAVLYNQLLEQENVFALEHKNTHHVIGSISVEKSSLTNDFPSMNCLEIGYVLHPQYQNKGIMSDVVKNLTQIFFQENLCECFLICCDEKNLASQKVALHNGFKKYKKTENIYYPALDEMRTLYCYYLEKEKKTSPLK